MIIKYGVTKKIERIPHVNTNMWKRIELLMRYQCLPYIMRHENYLNSPYKGMFIQIARWCNQPQFLKKKSFRQYCEANQFYKVDQSTKCSAKQAMDDFEEKFPERNDYFRISFIFVSFSIFVYSIN